ncbi:hypothetical protein EVAR_96897_1 [Eumeta japonica]|uniref:Uncharacterized protein n=1 Tax=Eumeta variegata TaxID=151549 RepID=A0A4C1WBZ5_EUMVA|nr:hypothetical protein EVAR_96897_1 [Eumeta japonica]
MQAPKRNRSARHEPVCMPISLSLSLALSLSLLGGLTVLEWKGRVPFTFYVCLSLLGGLTMPEWKGRVPLTRSHCERITVKPARIERAYGINRSPRYVRGVLTRSAGAHARRIIS